MGRGMGLLAAATLAALVAGSRAADFDYDKEGPKGPAMWSKIAPECAGTRQSPIDIQPKRIHPWDETHAFMKTYVPNMHLYDAKLENTGHGIKLNLDKSNVSTASSAFPDLQQLVQYHYHTPSEHSIDGELYPAELHLVHQPWDREISGSRAPTVVLGYMISESEKGEESPILDQVLEYADDLKAGGDSKKIKLAPMIPYCNAWANYKGSFTTPPCSEIVDWFVCEDSLKASKAQLEALKKITDLSGEGKHGTNRPVQPLNGRQVRTILTGRKPKMDMDPWEIEAKLKAMAEKEMGGGGKPDGKPDPEKPDTTKPEEPKE